MHFYSCCQKIYDLTTNVLIASLQLVYIIESFRCFFCFCPREDILVHIFLSMVTNPKEEDELLNQDPLVCFHLSTCLLNASNARVVLSQQEIIATLSTLVVSQTCVNVMNIITDFPANFSNHV